MDVTFTHGSPSPRRSKQHVFSGNAACCLCGRHSLILSGGLIENDTVFCVLSAGSQVEVLHQSACLAYRGEKEQPFFFDHKRGGKKCTCKISCASLFLDPDLTFVLTWEPCPISDDNKNPIAPDIHQLWFCPVVLIPSNIKIYRSLKVWMAN